MTVVDRVLFHEMGTAIEVFMSLCLLSPLVRSIIVCRIKVMVEPNIPCSGAITQDLGNAAERSHTIEN